MRRVGSVTLAWNGAYAVSNCFDAVVRPSLITSQNKFITVTDSCEATVTVVARVGTSSGQRILTVVAIFRVLQAVVHQNARRLFPSQRMAQETSNGLDEMERDVEEGYQAFH